MPTTAVKREFCRRLFRVGGASANLRHAFLDVLSDAALKASQSGKALISTGAAGTTAQFQLFEGWTPDEVIQLVDAARAWADAENVADALAMIIGPIRSFRPDFGGLRN